ncbi:MAG: helix-turn-helix domain-containing protein [Solirubrobacteraceae bacterium]
MTRIGRPKTELTLTEPEREQSVWWERRRKSSQALALRSRIVLACAEGAANKDVAVSYGVSANTVGKWRRRFCELRLDGQSDDPRPGRPATITAAHDGSNQVERWFAYLTDDLLRRSDHRSVQALEKDLRDWVAAWNQDPRPFTWTKTAEQILESLSRFLQRATTSAANYRRRSLARSSLYYRLRFAWKG